MQEAQKDSVTIFRRKRKKEPYCALVTLWDTQHLMVKIEGWHFDSKQVKLVFGPDTMVEKSKGNTSLRNNAQRMAKHNEADVYPLEIDEIVTDMDEGNYILCPNPFYNEDIPTKPVATLFYEEGDLLTATLTVDGHEHISGDIRNTKSIDEFICIVLSKTTRIDLHRSNQQILETSRELVSDGYYKEEKGEIESIERDWYIYVKVKNPNFGKVKELLPSNFTGYAIGSIFQNSETETIAQNIMKILNRTGNTWRSLSWTEYKKERLKDKNFWDGEKVLFDKVRPYCLNAKTAATFAPGWGK